MFLSSFSVKAEPSKRATAAAAPKGLLPYSAKRWDTTVVTPSRIVTP